MRFEALLAVDQPSQQINTSSSADLSTDSLLSSRSAPVAVSMPRHNCHLCRAPLHAADGHGECVSSLGVAHAETGLNETSPLCGYESLLSVFMDSFLFRERFRSSCSPAFFLPGTCEEKAAGQRITAYRDE